jgi:hypothetical protein
LTPLPAGGLPPSVAPSLRRNVSLDDEDDEDGEMDGVDEEMEGDERKKQERMERRPERTIDLGTAAAPRSPNAATEDGPGVLIACSLHVDCMSIAVRPPRTAQVCRLRADCISIAC